MPRDRRFVVSFVDGLEAGRQQGEPQLRVDARRRIRAPRRAEGDQNAVGRKEMREVG